MQVSQKIFANDCIYSSADSLLYKAAEVKQ